MNPGHYDFNVRRNSTVIRTFYLKDKDGVAIQIPSDTAQMQVRKGPGTDVILSLTTDPDGGLVIDAVAGSVKVTMPYSLMASKAPGNYQYDIRLLNTTDNIADYILEGKFNIKAVITE